VKLRKFVADILFLKVNRIVSQMKEDCFRKPEVSTIFEKRSISFTNILIDDSLPQPIETNILFSMTTVFQIQLQVIFFSSTVIQCCLKPHRFPLHSPRSDDEI